MKPCHTETAQTSSEIGNDFPSVRNLKYIPNIPMSIQIKHTYMAITAMQGVQGLTVHHFKTMPKEENASLEMSPTRRHNPTKKSKQTWIRISISQPLSEE